MQSRLEHSDWIAGPECTVADIALYAYAHLASEGGLEPASFAAIGARLGRVEALPGHSPITEV
jgi:glutathione S-transferase